MFFRFRGLFILFLLFAEASTERGPSSFLAPKSSVQQIERLPVWEILKVLELEHFPTLKGARIVSTENYDDGAQSVLIETEGGKSTGLVEKGLGILQQELPPIPTFGLNQFELLFNERNYLIGIFPARDRVLEDLIVRRWSYFDLSHFYFDLRECLEAKSKKKWIAFAQQWQKDQSIIQNFLNSRNISEAKLISMEKGLNWQSEVYTVKRPFVYVGVDKNANSSRTLVTEEFYPNEFFELKLKKDPNKHQIIIPVFPTVYSAYKFLTADRNYYKGIYYGIRNEFKLDRGDRVLLMGPGSGFDTWLAWLKTQTTIHAAGINPLEVANVKTTAELAGIDLVITQHNNIIAPSGHLVFDLKEFTKFLWNMPAFNPIGKIKELCTLEDWWDHHFYEGDMLRFLNGLSLKLISKGKALLWSTWASSLWFREDDRFWVWPKNKSVYQSLFILTKKEPELSIYDPTGCDSSL